MKIKWITIADTHLRLTETLGKIEGNINTRTRDKLLNLKSACKTAVDKKCKFVVLLGDIFDVFNPHERLRSYFIEAIKELLINKIPIYYLIGNHETDMDSVNFGFMQKLQNIIEDTPKLVVINETLHIPIEGYSFIYIPAVYKDDEILSYFKRIKTKLDPGKVLVFGHWNTVEAVIGEDEFRMGDGIPCSEYADFSRVYIGGFHKYQKYDNWMYPGALSKKNFSERSDAKGFLYSELETDTGIVVDEFIPIKDRPFTQVEINRLEADKILETITEVKDAIIKLVFKGSKQWYFSIDKVAYIKQFYNNGAHKVFTDFENTETLKLEDAKITASSKFEDDIKEFFTTRNRKNLIQPAIDILETVNKQIIKEEEI